jgi:hypothetical protein
MARFTISDVIRCTQFLFFIADFLNSVRISDCNLPNRYFRQSMNSPVKQG